MKNIDSNVGVAPTGHTEIVNRNCEPEWILMMTQLSYSQIQRKKTKSSLFSIYILWKSAFFLVSFIHCENPECRLLNNLLIPAAQFTCQQVNWGSSSTYFFHVKPCYHMTMAKLLSAFIFNYIFEKIRQNVESPSSLKVKLQTKL